MMRRWLITGCNGQLGFALGRQLASYSDAEILAAVDLPEVDVSDADSVTRLFDELHSPPEVVLNAAAYTHVDRCEREPELAQRANALAPGLLAEAAARCGAQFVHVSTDYVFPGDADRPYREDDAPGPRSVYGRTKLEGEERVRSVSDRFLVVRTSWVFGRGRNFLAAILDQAQQRRRGEAEGPLRVVDDQRGRPTYAEDLAQGLRALVAADADGLVHLAGGGSVATWWELARACLDAAGFEDLGIDKLRSADLETAAPRPSYSVLDCSRADALGVSLRDWRQAVAAYLASPEAPALEAAS
ncbi:MAG: dTDP-4-dehydrorhamnose reductase [Deltaproteobacteria bacterium]|nr:dTDP-4-dehydrorhamnose reductase [Deltaproteobacteria bacterium]